MSKRLQVLLPDDQYAELAAAARRRGMTVAAWVRGVLRGACRREPSGSAERKVAAVRAAFGHSYPTADIDEMLEQIESGYGTGEG